MQIKKRSTQRKISLGRVDNQQTQPTCDTKSGNQSGSHWWEASALTPPSLHPIGSPCESKYLQLNKSSLHSWHNIFLLADLLFMEDKGNLGIVNWQRDSPFIVQGIQENMVTHTKSIVKHFVLNFRRIFHNTTSEIINVHKTKQNQYNST